MVKYIKVKVKPKFKIILLMIIHGYIVPKRFWISHIFKPHWFWTYKKFNTCGDEITGYIRGKQFIGDIWHYPLWAVEKEQL